MFDRFRLLHVRPIRRHPIRSGLVALAIASGVTLLVTVLVLGRSITAPVGELSGDAGDVDLVAQGVGDAGLPVEIIEQVRRTEGVEEAAPVVRISALVGDRRTPVIGAPPEALSMGLIPAGCHEDLRDLDPLSLADGVLAGPGLDPDDGTVPLALPWGRTVDAPVVGHLTCADARRLNDGHFVVGIVPFVWDLTDRIDRVDTILLRTSAPAATVAARLEPVLAGVGVVERPAALVAQAERAIRLFQQALLIMAVLALVVGGFLTFNVVTVSVLERRHEMATVWALGLRRRSVVRGMLAEVAILGTIGSIAGAALGVALARSLLDRVPGYVLETIEVGPSLTVRPLDVIVGIALGIGSALSAAAFPSLEAVRSRDPSMLRLGGGPDAPTDRKVMRPTATCGLVAIAVGATSAAFLPSTILFSLGALVAGVIVTTFGLAPTLATVAAWLAAGLGRPGRVAGLIIGRTPRRVWSSVMAIAATVAVIVTTGSLTSDHAGTFDRMWRSMATVDIWAQTLPVGREPLGPRWPADTAVRAEAVAGVTTVSGGWSRVVDLQGSRITLDALLPGSARPGYRLASAAARRRLDAGTGLVVSSNLANRLNLRRGDLLALPTEHGPRRLEVVDVIDLLIVTEGMVAVPHRWAATTFDQPGFSWLEIGVSPTADRRRVTDDVRDVLSAPDRPTAFLASGQANYDAALEGVRRSTDLLSATRWAIGSVAALAVATTLVLSVNERRGELGVLRAVGLGATTVRRMLVTEALAYSALGLALGLAIGVIQFKIALYVVFTLIGTHFDGDLNAGTVVDAVLAVGAISLGAGGLAACLGSSGSIDAAINYE